MTNSTSSRPLCICLSSKSRDYTPSRESFLFLPSLPSDYVLVYSRLDAGFVVWDSSVAKVEESCPSSSGKFWDEVTKERDEIAPRTRKGRSQSVGWAMPN
jgi:hypothetical protein